MLFSLSHMSKVTELYLKMCYTMIFQEQQTSERVVPFSSFKIYRNYLQNLRAIRLIRQRYKNRVFQSVFSISEYFFLYQNLVEAIISIGREKLQDLNALKRTNKFQLNIGYKAAANYKKTIDSLGFTNGYLQRQNLR